MAKKDFIIRKNKLIRYIGKDIDIVIPDGVASIGDSAFSTCAIRSLTIPASVTSIAYAAFYECFYVESITVHKDNPVYHSAGNCLIETETKTLIQGTSDCAIPNDGSVEIIRSFAFDYTCEGLLAIEIPASVTKIERCAFSLDRLQSISVDKDNAVYHSDGNCLIETKTGRLILGCNNSVIPMDGSIKIIGEFAFSSCGDFKSIEIPSGVTKIEYHAFSFCQNLASIVIPASVEEIVDCPFLGCKGIGTSTSPNKEAVFGYEIGFEKGERMTIYGEKGSCAEKHANGFKIPFVFGKPVETGSNKIVYEGKKNIDLTITLTFEDKSRMECFAEIIFSVENKEYIAFAPQDADHYALFIYRLIEMGEGNLKFECIEDNQEINLAFYAYEILTYKERDCIPKSEKFDSWCVSLID